MTPGHALRRLSVLALVAAVSGCAHTPEGHVDSYRAEAAATLDAVGSHLGTTELALRALLADRLFTTSADDTITTAEVALDSLSSSFGSLQPPRGGDEVRDQAEAVLSAAEDAVTAARVATRRADRAGERSALDDVTAVTDRIDGLRKSWSA
jgi:hypothetical protein